MTKKLLREQYKTKRASLDGPERLRLDDLLLLKFQQLNYASISTVMSYWPLSNAAEPNTHLFTGYLRHMIPGLTIVYPVTDNNSLQMTPVSINEDTVYRTSTLGITEPKEGEVVPIEHIDLVLVPLLAFDKKGYRVGFGKGFYDRFLATCREDVVTIGFSYFEPVDNITDTDQFDVPLTYCITPQNIYEF